MKFIMVKTASKNILQKYVILFKNDLQKTRVTKSVIFKEKKRNTRFV